jgi:prepilin-type processing-associated H-X9-DG protein
MSPMQKELYRGRTLSCNNCAKPFTADDLTPVEMPARRATPAPVFQPVPAPAPQAPAKRSGWGVTLMTVGGALLLILLLVVVLLPPLSRAREQANRVKCASNLRQLGQAMFIYASVNGGAFPDKLDKLLSYIGAATFVCPSGDDDPAPGATPQIQANNLYAGGHLSYVYVGAGLSTTTGPGTSSTTVVLYEPLTNHNEGVNVLYADGSVSFLPRAAAQAMIASLPPAATQGATQPATQPTTQPAAGGGR